MKPLSCTVRSILMLACLYLLNGPVSITAQSKIVKDATLRCIPGDYQPAVFEGSEWTKTTYLNSPLWEARKADSTVMGIGYMSQDFSKTVAYSGKALEIFIALSKEGVFEDVRLIQHHEPIILAGIPEQRLHDFIDQYKNKNIRDLLKSEILGEGERKINLDAVSGATVTALVADQVILGTAREMGKKLGIIDESTESNVAVNELYEKYSWQELRENGLLENVYVSQKDIFENGSEESIYLDLDFGVINQPSLGINLLGEDTWHKLKEENPGKAILVFLNNGEYSFKGSGFVRGGIFDRIQVVQGMNAIRFKDTDYNYQFNVLAEGAPSIAEKAIFIVDDADFNPALSWDLNILITRRTHETAKSKDFKTYNSSYLLPEKFVDGERAGPGLTSNQAMLLRIWKGKQLWVVLYVILWILTILVFAFRMKISANMRILRTVHLTIMAIAIVLVGIGQKGQASVVNIFTFFDIVIHQSSFEPFLAEPFIFVTWIFIAITLVLWGRGPFCGWLCPYGALQEFIYEVKKRVRRTAKSLDFELSTEMDKKLRLLPYLVFVVLMLISLFSLRVAELGAEIEPFKSTWLVGLFNRPVLLTIYGLALIGMGFFTFRFFCRYICPLGGALAILARFQIFKIPRRNFCTSCTICAKNCEPKAIDKDGAIDSSVCLGCLECIHTMNNKKLCPPLRKKEIWDKYENV